MSFSLLDLMNQDIYFYAEPDILDWTKEELDKNYKIFFCTSKNNVCFNLTSQEEIEKLAASFSCIVNNNNLLIGYNIKNIISYLVGKTGILIDINKFVYDLAILQSYFSLDKTKPKNLKDSLNILRKVTTFDSWISFKKLYLEVYNPLLKTVVPKLETNLLVDVVKKNFVSSFYEIEGQANGRMKCSGVLQKCFVPHTMNETVKEKLRPTNPDDVFIYLDFKHMEVSVLQWLSKDQRLKEILESGDDVYESIWENIVKQKANEKQRTICKNVFLPVVFGQGSLSLSKKLGLEEKISKMLINSLKKAFPTAFGWVNDQPIDSENYAFDVFGRKRKFEKNDVYKIKNFCIQSPASMICLKKLVALHECLKDKASLCFHVHDGYCVTCDKNNVNSVADLAINALQKDEDLFPDLRLSVTCKFGKKLNYLKGYNHERNSKYVSDNRI